MQPNLNIGAISITGIKNETSGISNAAPRQLPVTGSIADIFILDKSGDIYKLLINGMVFQASIPIDIKNGEQLLAKILSHNPFVLSLNNLFNTESSDVNSLLNILKKMKINDSKEAREVIKLLLDEKLPLVKSKIERMISILGQTDLQFNDKAMGFLAAYINDSRTNDDFPDGKSAGIFQYVPGELSVRIFNSLMNICRSSASDFENAVIKNLVLANGPDSIERIIAIKENFSRIMQTIVILESNKQNLSSELARLEELLVRYAILKAHYQKIGRYPEFLIMKNTNGYAFASYEFNSDNDRNEYGTKKLQLQMNPEHMGLIQFEAIYTSNSLNSKFISSEPTKRLMQENSRDLKTRLEKSINGSVILNFQANSGQVDTFGHMSSKINFKL